MNSQQMSGAVQSKVWGQTQCIFVGPYSETHFLKIQKSGKCSEHRHDHKWNRFFLISGILKVTIYRTDGEDTTILEAGHFTDVPPGVFHQFEAIENCECLEIYWIDNLNPQDIDRRTVGSIGVSFDPRNHEGMK